MTLTKNRNIKIEITEEELNKRLDQIELLNCEDDLRQFLKDALWAIVELDKIIGMKNTTIARLRKIFGKKTEKTPRSNSGKGGSGTTGGRNEGQGNNGKDDYSAALKIIHELDESLKPGCKCPECLKGTLHKYESSIHIKIVGSPTLRAVAHEAEKSRCNTCGTIFEADFEGKGKNKYDATAISIIAIMHYMASFPFYRLEKIQKQLKTPMPRSVQWQLMEELANILIYVWKSLITYGKEGDLFYTDDTGSKILTVIKENKKKGKKDRTGMHTTGIISKRDDNECILFFTGRKYSGENFDDFLDGRLTDRPVAFMSDALNQNDPKTVKEIIHYLCLTHGRRKFEDLEESFKEEVKFVQDHIALIYKHDKYCKENEITGEERLKHHQEHSGPVMDKLYAWCNKCFDDRLVEPNSTLGKGIKYLLNHWKGLTGFLKYPDAPLDNNKLEAHLRVPVLNRKNWLFFKNEMGAFVGDIILSILKTCEANNIDSYSYLNYIQNNKDDVKKNPANYLPWAVSLSDI